MEMTKFAATLFADTKLAWLWLPLRFYLGWQWLMAGWEKIENPLWVGASAGQAVEKFLQGALQKTTGIHPDVSSWYAWFIEHVALQHTEVFSYLVSFGEAAVGVALLLGVLTGVAAFFGLVMNFNYLFAGTLSANPLFVLIGIFLVLAWRTAGWYGLDRYLLLRFLEKKHSSPSLVQVDGPFSK